MALWQAIEQYHELLTGDIAAESQGQLVAQQERRGLYFGDRPLATVLRPRFMAPEQYRHLEGRVRVVLRALQRAYDAALADRSIRSQFGLTDWEETLIQDDPGYREPHPTARLDAFYVAGRGGLRFMEYNGEVPASPAYNDVLTELYLGLPIMREFLKTYRVRPLPARHNTLHALTNSYAQWLGRHERPRIAESFSVSGESQAGRLCYGERTAELAARHSSQTTKLYAQSAARGPSWETW